MSGPPFGTIYADPPWAYANSSLRGAAASQYVTMSDADIAAIPVASWAKDNATLAMWCTWPKLREGLVVMHGWGFDYVTACPWVKTVPGSLSIRRGIGFWFMSASEVLLIGKRGEPRRRTGEAPPIGLLIDGRVFYAPVGRHSAKPLEVREWLEQTCDGPYLELFAREERANWTTWGMDTGFKLTSSGVERVEPAAAPVARVEQRSLFA